MIQFPFCHEKFAIGDVVEALSSSETLSKGERGMVIGIKNGCLIGVNWFCFNPRRPPIYEKKKRICDAGYGSYVLDEYIKHAYRKTLEER